MLTPEGAPDRLLEWFISQENKINLKRLQGGHFPDSAGSSGASAMSVTS